MLNVEDRPPGQRSATCANDLDIAGVEGWAARLDNRPASVELAHERLKTRRPGPLLLPMRDRGGGGYDVEPAQGRHRFCRLPPLSCGHLRPVQLVAGLLVPQRQHDFSGVVETDLEHGRTHHVDASLVRLVEGLVRPRSARIGVHDRRVEAMIDTRGGSVGRAARGRRRHRPPVGSSIAAATGQLVVDGRPELVLCRLGRRRGRAVR